MGLAINRAASAGMEAMSPGILFQILHPLWIDGEEELGRGTGNWVAGGPTPTAQALAQC